MEKIVDNRGAVGWGAALILTSLAILICFPALANAASVTLTWTAPGDDSTSGTAAQYDIRYSTSLITEANWSLATQVTGEPGPKAPGSAESLTIPGLNPNTTYYFAIKTADEVPNWSALSNVATVKTPDTQPPAAIKDLTAKSP